MVRKASSLSCNSSLTRMKKSSLPGAGAPLLNKAGFESAAGGGSDDSIVGEALDQE